jgi:hypothetical protein
MTEQLEEIKESLEHIDKCVALVRESIPEFEELVTLLQKLVEDSPSVDVRISGPSSCGIYCHLNVGVFYTSGVLKDMCIASGDIEVDYEQADEPLRSIREYSIEKFDSKGVNLITLTREEFKRELLERLPHWIKLAEGKNNDNRS